MKTQSFHVLILIVLLAAGCTGKKTPSGKNALLPDRLVLFSPVPFSEQEVAQSTDFQAISAYNESLLSKALAGELTVYNAIVYRSNLSDSKEMSLEDLLSNLDLEEADPGNYQDEIVSRVGEILSGFFVEEWFFDEEEFEFRKNVIQYQPTWHKPYYYDGLATGEDVPDDTLRILLFGVHNDPPRRPASLAGDSDYTALVKDFSYELELYNQSFEEIIFNYETPLIDEDQWVYYNFMYYKDFDRDRLIDLIFEKVLSGQVPAYSPVDRTTLMDIPAIHDAMGADSIFVPFRNEEGNYEEKFIEVYMPLENINSVIFIEDWYYNKESLALVKVVKGIIPVLHYLSADYPQFERGEIERIPLFAILFNQSYYREAGHMKKITTELP